MRKPAGTCETCHYPMRHPNDKKAAFPGTRIRQTLGQCQTCYHKEVRERKRSQLPTKPCTGCGTLMRPRNSKAGSYPEGVVTEHDPGLCLSCTGKARRATAAQARQDPQHIAHDADPNLVSGLLHYLARREARIDRAQRITRIRQGQRP